MADSVSHSQGICNTIVPTWNVELGTWNAPAERPALIDSGTSR